VWLHSALPTSHLTSPDFFGDVPRWLRHWTPVGGLVQLGEAVLRLSPTTQGFRQLYRWFFYGKLRNNATAHDPLHVLSNAVINARLLKDTMTMTSGDVSFETYAPLVLQHADSEYTLQHLKDDLDVGRRLLLLAGGHLGPLCCRPLLKAATTGENSQDDGNNHAPPIGTDFAPYSIYKRAKLPILRAMGDALGPEYWKRGMCSLGHHALDEMANPRVHVHFVGESKSTNRPAGRNHTSTALSTRIPRKMVMVMVMWLPAAATYRRPGLVPS
jgi:hypothetical protein